MNVTTPSIQKLLGLAGVLLLSLTPASAVVIAGYNSTLHDRFSSGFSSSPVPNASPSFIGTSYDFSGVGWNAANPLQSVTLINNQYFIGAKHFMPSAGSTIQFYSPTLNTVVNYTVDSFLFQGGPVSPFTTESGDLAIGRLTTPVGSPDGLASYPILDLGSFGAYTNLPVLVYGHGGSASNSPRIGTNNIDLFHLLDMNPAPAVADSIAYSFDDDGSPTGEAYLVGQDSGSPTFAVFGGQLALVGTHAAVGTVSGMPASFDNFAAIYVSQINTAGITITVVPEPGTSLLSAMVLGSVALRRRRAV